MGRCSWPSIPLPAASSSFLVGESHCLAVLAPPAQGLEFGWIPGSSTWNFTVEPVQILAEWLVVTPAWVLALPSALRREELNISALGHWEGGFPLDLGNSCPFISQDRVGNCMAASRESIFGGNHAPLICWPKPCAPGVTIQNSLTSSFSVLRYRCALWNELPVRAPAALNW